MIREPVVSRHPRVSLRPIAEADLPACVDVFYEAVDELHSRNARPRIPRNPEAMLRMFGHLRATDPQRCWLAEADGTVNGYAIAHRREGTWFLSFLFVRPAHQASGIGRALTEAASAVDRGEGSAPDRMAVCASAMQPVSIGLYTSAGMLPRSAHFLMTGRRTRPVPAAGHDLDPVPFTSLAGDDHIALARTIDVIDRQTIGYAHPQDHRFWMSTGRVGWLFRRTGGGDDVGYGYAQPSGRIGPVAVLEPGWLPEAVDHLCDSVQPTDGYQLFVPGESRVMAPLLRAGMRFDADATLYLSSDGQPAFERYLPGNFAML